MKKKNGLLQKVKLLKQPLSVLLILEKISGMLILGLFEGLQRTVSSPSHSIECQLCYAGAVHECINFAFSSSCIWKE